MNALQEAEMRSLVAGADDRIQLWASLLRQRELKTMAEIGVYRGLFSRRILKAVPSLERYYMIDPWRNLDDWDKPLNKSDDAFEEVFAQAMKRTEPFAAKRVVLRGRTVEVIDQIPDDSLDFAYVDADHTLRGIAVDLGRVYPKVRDGGFIAGDDFTRNIFQHGRGHEPSLVFPYAVYFAEAMGMRIFALPYQQFVMQKIKVEGDFYVEIAGGYSDTTLLRQLKRQRTARRKPRKWVKPLRAVRARVRRSAGRSSSR